MRRRSDSLDGRKIDLSAGNGGRHMRDLINRVFVHHLENPLLDVEADAVSLPLNLRVDEEVMFTTDSFTVQPLEFPGGDIGSLAIFGTVNDLAVSGARPQYLSLNVIVEEGLEISVLDRIIQSLSRSASEAGVVVVAGDTKVVGRGEGGGLYLATSGVGIKNRNLRLGVDQIRQDDLILVSGPVGDHGIAIMLAREEFGLRGALRSDCASVLSLTQALLHLSGLRFMRDPTRGGVATVFHDISRGTGMRVRFRATDLAIRKEVRSACDILGFNPLYMASEGRVVAVIAPEQAEYGLELWRATPGGADAAIVGQVCSGPPAVVMETSIGGERFIDELEGDPLPRIC